MSLMNKKNYTLEELSRLLVQIGRIKHGNDSAACAFAYDSIFSMLNDSDVAMKFPPERYQEVVNENMARAQKELAAL